MKLSLKRILLTAGIALLFAGPSAVAAAKVRPQVVFDHKYEKKYNCKVRLDAIRLFAPMMSKEFKAELTDYYIALSKAIEDAYNSFEGSTGEVSVCAKDITSVLTVKEDGLMDVKIELSKAWLTLHNVTVKDLKKVFEKYLA